MVCVQVMGVAVATNFGYEFRRTWYRNYVFVAFVLGFSFWLAYIVFVPGKLSCYWRVNCTNDNVVRPVDAPDPTPIGNPFATTVRRGSWSFVVPLRPFLEAQCFTHFYASAHKTNRFFPKNSDGSYSP